MMKAKLSHFHRSVNTLAVQLTGKEVKSTLICSFVHVMMDFTRRMETMFQEHRHQGHWMLIQPRENDGFLMLGTPEENPFVERSKGGVIIAEQNVRLD